MESGDVNQPGQHLVGPGGGGVVSGREKKSGRQERGGDVGQPVEQSRSWER